MQTRPKINSEEWMVIFALILLMTTLTYLSHEHWLGFENITKNYSHDIKDNNITVNVEGAVRFAGKKEVRKGTKLKEIIEMSDPFESADLDNLPLEKGVKDGQRIQIYEKEYVTVYVKGAVSIPGALIMRKGSTVGDLIKRLSLQENADISKLNGRKRLKEGDIIKIQSKK